MSADLLRERCQELNPERTHMCDQPRGHGPEIDHEGPELPVIFLDESDPAYRESS